MIRRADAASVAHFVLPWAIRAHARRPGGGVPGEGYLAVYDMGTVALAAVGSGQKTRRALGLASASVVLCTPSGLDDVCRTVVVAAAEEVLWRRHRAWSVVPFALMHRPAQPARWPYHLLTGSAFHAARALGGLPTAVILHAAHNLLLPRRRSLRADRGTGHSADSARASSQAPAATPSSSWPVSPATGLVP